MRRANGQSSASMDSFRLPDVAECQPSVRQDIRCRGKSHSLLSGMKSVSFPTEDRCSAAHAYKVRLDNIGITNEYD